MTHTTPYDRPGTRAYRFDIKNLSDIPIGLSLTETANIGKGRLKRETFDQYLAISQKLYKTGT